MRLTLWPGSIVARLRSWLRAATHRRALESEMDSELCTHFELLTADLIRAGHTPQQAARRAHIEIGAPLMHKENMRASLGLRWLDELADDLRYASRLLRKSPGFTLIAAASLALAIGANTAIFSVAKQVLYERLNVPHAANLRLLSWTGTERGVAVHHVWGDYDSLPGGIATSTSFSYPAFRALQSGNGVLDDLFAFKETGVNATIGNNAQSLQMEMVSGNYYQALQVRPALGRAIQPSDDAQPGQGAVAVISDGLWARAFGRSPGALGQIVKVNYTPLTIVGVNPPSFTGAKNVQQSPDIFVPLSMQSVVHPTAVRKDPSGKPYASALANPEYWWVNVMGRARAGVSDSAAQAALRTQLTTIVRATMPVRKSEDLPQLAVQDGSRGLFRQQRTFAKPMAVLMTLVGFVLLLACANVANLLLARGARRQREMSVRMALGAGRLRILRQMLVESLLLSALGGAGGLLAGFAGSVVIPRLTQNAWEHADFHVHFDWLVFGFTAVITLATGLLFGVAPALAAARAEVTHGLKEGAQTVTRRRKGLNGRLLVGFQIALSTLLVAGAGLFLRTFDHLSHVELGFNSHNLLLVEINPPPARYPAGKDVVLQQQLEQAFVTVPGVENVTPALEAYVSDDYSATDFLPAGEKYDSKKNQEEVYNLVGNRFFETMRIPIVAGRGFSPQDTAGSPAVAVVNQALVRARFAGQNPIGKRFSTSAHNSDGKGKVAADSSIEIVGVCGDTRYTNLRDAPPPQFILPYVQQPEVGGMTFELRSSVKPEALLPELRSVVRQIDPDLPLVNVRTQDEQVAADLVEERVFVALTAGFGMLALLLAAVGIYGVMAFSVAQRRSEIGIRMALGAKPAQVRGMVLRESVWIAVVGVAAGLAGVAVLTRLIKNMLYGVAPNDPLTLAGTVILLLGVALVASWIPARRAASVQPMQALRHE